MRDVEIIGILKTYVQETLEGAGALNGAPCQIKQVTDNGDGTQTMTFLWEDNDGVEHTTPVILPSGIFYVSSPQTNQVLAYDSVNQLFVNFTLGDAAFVGTTSTPVSEGLDAFTSGGAYTELGKKVDKEAGKGLSTNDFTNTLKTKLDGIEDGAEVNIIETIKLNGTDLIPGSDREVDIEAVESISVNGVAQTVTAGSVDLDVATNLITEEQWTTIQSLLA